jgi:hypothetical protein
MKGRKDLGLMGAWRGHRGGVLTRAVCMGLCDPMENPTRESCEGGFLQYFREEI